MSTPPHPEGDTASPGLPAEERWYLPTLFERLQFMRWRVLYFVPAILVIPLVLLMPLAVLLWWKLLLILVAMPMSAAAAAAKRGIALRKEPFCIHCGYDLTGLPEGRRCPECGATFILSEIDDYRRDPHWFIRRQKLKQALPDAGAVFESGPVRSKRRRDGT